MMQVEVRMGEPALQQDRIPYEDYLAFEATAEERHMYWDGEVFAMAGASMTHTLLESNVHAHLFLALRGHPCAPFTGNQRLRALGTDRSVYPDCVVVCGKREAHPEDAQAATNPAVVVEVLSDSTEAFDRGDKFAYYRSFASLQELVFLSQKAVRVERYRRGADGDWTLRDLGPGEALELASVGVTVAVDDLYAGADFGEGAAAGA